MAGYAAWVDRYESSGGASLAGDADVDGLNDQVQDTLMLGLRLSQGLLLPTLAGRFGKQVARAVAGQLVPFVDRGLVEVVAKGGRTANKEEMEKREAGAPVADAVDHWKAAESVEDRSGDERAGYEDVVIATWNTEELWEEGGGKDKCGVPNVCMRLTDPEGFLVSNEVIATVFHELENAGGR